MTRDPEVVDAFASELAELKTRLHEILAKLEGGPNQFGEFAKFAQILHGIHSTAVSLGYSEVGDYVSIVRTTCERCAATKIERAAVEVRRMMKRFMDQLEVIHKSLRAPAASGPLKQEIEAEKRRADRIEREVFAFARK